LEETKRRKLARKCEKLVELMMVSGVPTASGYEERIQFSEMEVVERGANDNGLLVNMPEGHAINGWDVNVAAVRVASVKRTVRYHQHAVSLNITHLSRFRLYLTRLFRNSFFGYVVAAKTKSMLVEDTANLSSYIEDYAPSSLANIFLLSLARISLRQAPAGSATQKTMLPLYHRSPRRMPALPTMPPPLQAPPDEH